MILILLCFQLLVIVYDARETFLMDQVLMENHAAHWKGVQGVWSGSFPAVQSYVFSVKLFNDMMVSN